MPYNILSHVRSLEELHRLINKDPGSGAMEAQKKVVDEVHAVVNKLSQDAKK